MEDLSLHILDIAENSIAAGARTITIEVSEDSVRDVLTIVLSDDGRGMTAEVSQQVVDPFYTTRTTRDVGLGLPLFQEAAALAGGTLEVRSVPGAGTTVKATFRLSHVDRQPLGNMVETITALLCSSVEVDVLYINSRDGGKLVFDSKEIRDQLGSNALSSVKAISVIRGYLNQEEAALAH